MVDIKCDKQALGVFQYLLHNPEANIGKRPKPERPKPIEPLRQQTMPNDYTYIHTYSWKEPSWRIRLKTATVTDYKIQESSHSVTKLAIHILLTDLITAINLSATTFISDQIILPSREKIQPTLQCSISQT